jgi:hypothetical protein
VSLLQKLVVVGISVLADGTNNSFELDLAKDPYWLDASSDSGIEIMNWFTQVPKSNAPTAVVAVGSPDSVSLSGTVVTYTFATAPSAGQTAVEFQLLF